MTDAPDKIYLSEEDARLFGQKYGHPDMDWVEPEQPHVAYTRADAQCVEVKELEFKHPQTLEALKAQFTFDYPDGTDEQKRLYSNGWWACSGAIQTRDLINTSARTVAEVRAEERERVVRAVHDLITSGDISAKAGDLVHAAILALGEGKT